MSDFFSLGSVFVPAPQRVAWERGPLGCYPAEMVDREQNMDHASVVITARIRLLSTAEGGKARSVRGSWRPTHNFAGSDNRESVIGIVEPTGCGEVRPGDSAEARVQFLDQPGLRAMLHPGREWRIQEGARLVAMGTVLTVLPGA